MQNKIFISFLIYGCLVGFLSCWWRMVSDAIFIFNLPGIMLGDELYNLAISYFGNPNSSQAHYTIPWGWRIPQIYVLTSLIFWGIVGWLSQLIHRKFKNKLK